MDEVITPVGVRGLNEKQALERVIAFAQRFGPLHADLASHAAFPLVLTPDLLYRLWAIFLPHIPWTTVADILLSPLCREVGYELYEMDPAIRNILLKDLRQDSRFGEPRLQELAQFLEEYVARTWNSDDPEDQGLAEAQHLTALANTDPGKAAREIAEKLSEPSQLEGTELLRVAALTETLSRQLQDYSSLVGYARGVERLAHGDQRTGTDLLNRVFEEKQKTEIAGVTLQRPRQAPAAPPTPGIEIPFGGTVQVDVQEASIPFEKIFISYRRADSPRVVGRIRDRLRTAFGESSVFRDLVDIPAGEEFRTVLAREVEACRVMLVVIGPLWARMTDAGGNRRLFDPEDFTRREIEMGLANPEITVIPVLVSGARMPSSDEIPESLAGLLFQNGITVRNDPDFEPDMQTLVKAIKLYVTETAGIRRRAVRPVPPRPPRDFIGRAPEKERLEQSIRAGKGAAILITGSAGIGKSSLLRQVANGEVARAMPDGVLWINGLDETGRPISPGDLVQSLFDAFYESDPPRRISLEAARRYLSPIEALVILDQAQLPADMFTDLPGLLPKSVLMISSGEAPSGSVVSSLHLGPLSPEDAALLFTERATISKEELGPSLVDSICSLLGRVPLAIVMVRDEWRATQISLESLLQRLQEITPQSSDEENAGMERAHALVSTLSPTSAAEQQAAQKPNIYLSYARADRRLAEFLKGRLSALGYQPRSNEETTITIGKDWSEVLEQEIETSRFLIVLLSEDSVKSPWVQNEIQSAFEFQNINGEPQILVVRVRGIDAVQLPGRLPTELGHLQSISWNSERDNERLVSELVQAIDQAPPPVSQPNIPEPFEPVGIGETEKPKADSLVRKLKRELSIDIEADWWEKGGTQQTSLWSLNELEMLYRIAAMMAEMMGGNEEFSRNVGGVSVYREDMGRHASEAVEHRISFSNKQPLSAWTVVHNFAHAWDANTGWALSRELEKYTGGRTSTLRSLTLRVTGNWDAGPNGPENKPGRQGRLPGCNKAGYFYGDKPSGSNWSFNRVEDFADAVCMYVGWERGNDLSGWAKARIDRYLLADGQQSQYFGTDNWAFYKPYFYPENGDYTKTKRWQFIDELINRKVAAGKPVPM